MNSPPDTIQVGLVQANIGWDYASREDEEEDDAARAASPYHSTYILPYSVGLLQAYAQRFAKRPERYHFRTPIYRRVQVDVAVAQLSGCDVIGFSAYVWNEQLSLEIARRLKQLRPDTLIVFGGPQVPDHADAFLRRNPVVDIACHGEGEAVFLSVLENMPGRDWSGVRGISYLDADGRFVQHARDPRVKTLSALPSPFLDGTFDAVMKENPRTRWYLIWETNRGCPFSCTFCDWGSAVAGKVYQFDIDRLYREVDWMAERKIEIVYCADANFGILPRDLEIAQYAVASRQRHGYPASINVQSTKNATERAWQIQQLLGGSMSTIGVTVSFQSLDPHTLKAVKRDNISTATFQELQRRYARAGIPTYTDLILALPGETYTSFADGIDRLIRDGQHDRVMFHNCSVLPNAEMANPAYRDEHGLISVPQRILNSHAVVEAPDEVDEYLDIVVGTTAMPPDDWVRAKAFSFMVDFLYFDRVMQIPLLVAASKYGVRYRDLIEALSSVDAEEFPILAGVQAEFIAHARAIQRGGEEYQSSPDWVGLWWPADELAVVRLVGEGRLADFYAEAARALIRSLFDLDIEAEVRLLLEAIALNHRLFKVPFQDKARMLVLNYNIWAYYRGVVTGRPVPLEASVTRYAIPKSPPWPGISEWAAHIGSLQYRKQGFLHTPFTVRPQPVDDETEISAGRLNKEPSGVVS